ncbi:MAG TPA: class I SAM-dependent methyltransferase, partial [Solirubrobacteraceae bacterium]|nr:class I SAM-dependent methyltransferase [Solirubrobacteraceae bacterium]
MAADHALADLYEVKAQTYAAFGNGAIAAHARRLLPPGGRVLDVGCASGGLLALLRPHAAHLAGVELSPSAARAAARVADRVVCGALEDPQLPFEPASFDLVVLADVLEHLVDPAAGLARAAGWCRPGGAVLVSVPNVAHWQARLTLLRGRWPQRASGTFDAGHLRWFTRD